MNRVILLTLVSLLNPVVLGAGWLAAVGVGGVDGGIGGGVGFTVFNGSLGISGTKCNESNVQI